MAILYTDDFQSYSLGAAPPYGDLYAYTVNPSVIVDNITGVWGDTKSVSLGGLIYPSQTPTLLDPFYSEFTVFRSFRMGNTTNQRGIEWMGFNNINYPSYNESMARFEIFEDGTIGLVSGDGSFCYAVSDFSFKCSTWYTVRLDVSFSNDGGFVRVTFNIRVNGDSILSGAVTTGQHTGFASLWVNAIILRAAGNGGNHLGRTTIYDTIQADDLWPDPGTPSARVSQGVIELIQSLSSVGALTLACPVGGSTAVLGVPYSHQLVASGGQPPYTFSIISGALPPGLTLDPTTGIISGTPITSGVYSYTAEVEDLVGSTATAMCSITIPMVGTCVERFGPKIYFWEPSFLERPEDIALRATDYENCGLEGAKFLQGFILHADTMGEDKEIQIQGDEAEVLQNYTVNHDGESVKPYVFEPAKIASLVRLIGLDDDPWRFFGIRYIWEPLPELVTYYETQGTTHDIPGYQFLKDGYISLISTATVTLTVNVDGVDYVYIIPSTSGAHRKIYMIFGINNVTGRTLKGKEYRYILESSEGFRLYQKDCEVRVHAWSGGEYQVKQPFGEVSRVYGARI